MHSHGIGLPADSRLDWICVQIRLRRNRYEALRESRNYVVFGPEITGIDWACTLRIVLPRANSGSTSEPETALSRPGRMRASPASSQKSVFTT